MAFIDWSKKYELGIPEIDEQHRKWIEILNEFYDHIANKDVKGETIRLIERVEEYTKFHFSSEETFMASMGYSAIAEQKKMHADLVRRMAEFRAKYDNNQLGTSIPVTSELRKWLTDHILSEDRKYAELYLKANGK